MGEESFAGGLAPLYYRRPADSRIGCFLAHSGRGVATIPHSRALYVDRTATGSSIALADAWTGHGVFVFVPPGSVRFADGAAPADVVNRTTAVLEAQPDWKLIWFDDEWRADGLALRLDPIPDVGPDPVPRLQRPIPTAALIVDGEIRAADDLLCSVVSGAGVTLDPDRNRFTIAPVDHSGPSVLSVLGQPADVTGEITIDIAAGGMLAFDVMMPAGLDATIDLAHEGRRLSFPVFPVPPMAAAVTLDPGDIEAGRIDLAAAPGCDTADDDIADDDPVDDDPADDDPADGPVVTTGYRTTAGRPVRLRIREAWLSPRLVPAEGPASSRAPGQTGRAVALAPGGRFAAVDDGPMVAGLSGAETIGLDRSTEVRFHPTEPGSIEPESIEPGRLGHRTLSGRSTTSWCSISAGSDAGAGYFVQPLHEGYHQRSEADDRFWNRVEVRAAGLGPDDVFPMIPYGRFAGDPGLAARIEAGVIEPLRSRRIASAATAMEVSSTAPMVRGVTPSGFEAEVVDGVIRTIILARVGGTALAIDTSNDPELRTALSAEGRFTVVSNRPQFADLQSPEPESAVPESPEPESPVPESEPTSAQKLTIDGWDFDLVLGWNDRETIMLFKQDGTRAIAELVADPTSWQLPDRFNRRPGAVADRLQASVAAAEVSDDPVVSALFHRVLSDPNWRGVLIVGCEVPLDTLPVGLEVLQAGLSGKALSAHHLGIEQRPVVADQSTAGSDGDSSVFGLIVHEGTASGARPGRFSFAVDSLRVEIAGSTVGTVSADLTVGLGSFLDSGTAGGASLRLVGSEQRRNGMPHYVFVAAEAESIELRDAVLASVDVREAQLTTVVVDGTVEARFALSGELEFHPSPAAEPDLIGYRQLGFRGIDVVMSYTAADRSPLGFRWDAAAATVAATPVAHSLPQQFPLTARAMLSERERPPAALGFQNIRLPIEVDGPTVPWHGLLSTLDLGTMGELASTAGFQADFGLFWSPHPSERRLGLGLRFPGADVGAYGFTIQDVVKLATHGIVLHDRDLHDLDLHDLDPESTGQGGGRFQLNLQGLGIEVLGFAVPWSGSFDLTLEPGPEPADGLGWYGAYTPDTTSNREAE